MSGIRLPDAPRPLIVAVLALAAASGVWGWSAMPRQEDPRLPPRWAFLAVPYPGAAASDVERLIVEPVERELTAVDELVRIESTARAEVAVFELELSGAVSAPGPFWEEVRHALARARYDLPPGVGAFELDDDVVTPEAAVIALVAALPPLELLDRARELERDLRGRPEIGRVRIVGGPGEEVAIRVQDGAARRLGLDFATLADDLALRSSAASSGALRPSGSRLSIGVPAEFTSLEEIASVPLPLAGGGTVPLHAIAAVERQRAERTQQRMRLDGEQAVGLAISPRAGVDLIAFGRSVRDHVAAFATRHPELAVEEALFQPDHVAMRVRALLGTLVVAALVVAALLIAALGVRLGAVAASGVPLVSLATVGLYAAGGGALHQLSIAALILSLGLIVDNAIVMTESIQRRRGEGAAFRDAARASIQGLAVPLAVSTATTLAAFVPIYAASGTTADFVRAIPVLVGLALVLSYAFAVGVGPMLCATLGSPSRPMGARWRRLATGLAGVGANRPAVVLVGTGLAILCCLLLSLLLDWRLFPRADRNQLVVSLELPEGAQIHETDRAAGRLEEVLIGDPRVASLATFVGESTPLFYYNLNRRPRSPHLAQFAVTTHLRSELAPLAQTIRSAARERVPEASLTVQPLRQGMPMDAPVEIRISGTELPGLAAAAERVISVLRRVPGAVDVRHDLGLGSPVVRYVIDDAQAHRFGVTRERVARVVRGRTTGLQVGVYRMGQHPIPIVLRGPARAADPTRLATLDVAGPGTRPLPLSQLAAAELAWQPAVLHRRNGRRVVTVSSDLDPAYSADSVLRAFRSQAPALSLPPEVRLSYGGEAEGAAQAYGELLRYLPLGVALALCLLLLEFGSLRLALISASAVPVAAVGIVPGLLISDQPFGFMSMLGVLTVGGIALNNGIVLVDAVEAHRRSGQPLSEALSAAVEQRVRPVLLTAMTSIASVAPLALAGGELWPSMACAMMSGLAASAVLTLIAVPALYRLSAPDGAV